MKEPHLKVRFIRKILSRFNLRRDTTAIFYYMGFALLALLVTVIVVAVVNTIETGFSIESLDAQLSSTVDSFSPLAVIIVIATALFAGIRYLVSIQVTKIATSHVQSKIEALSPTSLRDRDEIERLREEQLDINHAAHEGDRSALGIYSRFSGRFNMEDIRSTLEACWTLGIKDLESPYMEKRLEFVTRLSQHRTYQQDDSEWQDINCYVLENPESIYEVEMVVARGITDMKTIYSLTQEANERSVTPVAEGWL